MPRRALAPILISLTVLLVSATLLLSQKEPKAQVGLLPDGGFLLNSGWVLRPAGKTVPLSTLPMSHALSGDGRTLAVLNGGFAPPSVSLLDAESAKEITRLAVTDGWRGLAFSPDGMKLYAGGGAKPEVTVLAKSGDAWKIERKWALLEEPKPQPHLIADLRFTVDGKSLLAVDSATDTISVLDPAAGTVRRKIATARNPYAMLPHPEGNSVFVTSWSTARVFEYSLSDGRELASVAVGAHPTEMLFHDGKLFVTCANTNSVYVLAKTSLGWSVAETLNLSLTPRQPAGMTPSALAVSRDGKFLYVACSDANAVAVVELDDEGSKVAGFVPTGWYPTGVRALPDGRLLVLNGKGDRSYPNPEGLTPYKWPMIDRAKAAKIQYPPFIQTGTAQFVPAFDAAQLAVHTTTVRANSPYRDSVLENAGVAPGNPIPNRPGDPSPIRYVVLIMKENRTYDQVFGDMKGSNADPSLLLFGENVTPNNHKLAREFGLLDNFYVNSDVSEDGEYWTTAAIAPDSTQKIFPMAYARRLYGRPKPSPEGRRTAPGGFIWDRALEAGVPIRNYGFTATNLPHREPDPAAPGRIEIDDVRDPVLKPYTNFAFRQHDRDFPDVERMNVVLREIREWEKTGGMPRLLLITVGNDHTEGTRPGACTPVSCVAENDQALGHFVEGFSRTRFWPKSAIFVLEDDAQDGPDHVDSHRSPAFVISPYTRRKPGEKPLESTMYNTTSVLRTIELILGLKPMTVFDAAATPMAKLFRAQPDTRPYDRLPARVSLTDKNPANSPTAARSMRLDWDGSDKNDDREMNEILYLAIQGKLPPPPVRSVFSR